MTKTAPKSLQALLSDASAHLDYHTIRPLLDHDDLKVRVQLAEHPNVAPEVLVFLAADPHEAVRCAVARNPNTPSQADLVLAGDKAEGVRVALADRMGSVLPNLDSEKRESLADATRQVLTLLARDQQERVRGIIADAVKDLSFIPHDVMLGLAKDSVLKICLPVLEQSPVLTDDDLVAIIRATPLTAQMVAISRRERVSETVSAAIVKQDDEQAIASLLSNEKAQIREDTLDTILAMAPKRRVLHRPLAARPGLPPKALAKIASFVAEQHLQLLTERADLPEKPAAILKRLVVNRLLDSLESAALKDSRVESAFGKTELDHAERQVELLRLDKKVVPEGLTDVLRSGRYSAAILMLAEFTNLKVEQVTTILQAAYPKAILSLCWKAGLSAKCAVLVQQTLGRVPPTAIIAPSPSDGFRLTEDEMEWYLNMFTNAAQIPDGVAQG